MFSKRVPRSLQPNRITQALHRARASARPLVDLTVTNPTAVGLHYPPSLLDHLNAASALTYAPRPFGSFDARQAVARDYRRRGLDVDPQRIVLTASTSEAYSLLFKLLCDPGDAVMVPTPSYPLFEHLTTLDGVRAIPYPLEYEGRWSVAFDDLDRCWNDAVRGVLAVSPNNPTGSVLSADETASLQARCASRAAALILDEVFCDYPLLPEAVRADGVAPKVDESLTFRLGGLSKSAGLPQVKLGWIAVSGPEQSVADALGRLEVICDAYLSVSTPVQVAAASLIEAGGAVRVQILSRIRRNHGALLAAVAAHPALEALAAQAGWSSVVRVPSTRSEEDLVVDLIEQDDVVVHPGFFFDFPREAFVVVSLLPEPAVFDEGIRRLLERADA